MTYKHIVVLYRAGVSLAEIAQRFNLTRERVEEIVDTAFIGKKSVTQVDANGLNKLTEEQS